MNYDYVNNENINYEETDFDRTNVSDCAPCHIRVNELGLYQCTGCRAIFEGRTGSELVRKSLIELNGVDCWEEAYEELEKIRSLVNQKKFDQLQMTLLVLRDNNGNIKTSRRFYALKH